MTMEVIVPRVGVSVTEVVVVEWHVADGSVVQQGQRLVTVATDKVDVDIEAPAEGTLQQAAVVEQSCPVGSVIGRIEQQ